MLILGQRQKQSHGMVKVMLRIICLVGQNDLSLSPNKIMVPVFHELIL